jgi:hypothetical protein
MNYRPPPIRAAPNGAARITSWQFFGHLRWLDGRPLVNTIEDYRKELFRRALDDLAPDGAPRINFVLAGRGKKNWKSADLILAALFCLLVRTSPQGSNCYILANDEGQAGDDLDIAKRLIAANPDLSNYVTVLNKEIKRKDGKGSLTILPGKDVAGSHGKTGAFVGFDEIHAYRNYDLLEALTLDPTRKDALTWVTSYDTVYNTPGIPLHDFKVIGKAGSDPRMLFSWYSGDYCTDPDFADLEPELRANPSIASWPEGRSYLDQQRRRLPTHKFRRLHLNLPGSPSGAFLDQGALLDAIDNGRVSSPPQTGIRYYGFVDMSGGSSCDAALAISHRDGRKAVVDLVVSQAGKVPFNPRTAVKKFAGILKQYRCSEVFGDNFAGETFKADFAAEQIRYHPSPLSKTELYEYFEPLLNAGEVSLPDVTKLQEQFLTLIVKGARIEPQAGDFDDWSNACAGSVWRATDVKPVLKIPSRAMAWSLRKGPIRIGALGR